VNSVTKTKAPLKIRRPSKAEADVRDVDYHALARFRYELRKFLTFSEAAAQKQQLTPQQHQALLTIKGFSQDGPISIGDLAKLLLIRHHTAGELADRMTALGLIVRVDDPEDGRKILVRLTADGERRLRKLSKIHFEELAAVSNTLTGILKHFRRSKGL
jgi:DNA-binding MarR family transcriptional regulator